MNKELSITEVNQQVAEIKNQMKGFDSGRLNYEIRTFNPNLSQEYQLVAKGTNVKGSVYEKFSNEIDTILNSPSVARIKISCKDSRKPLMDVELILRGAYSHLTPVLTPIVEQKPAQEQSQQAYYQQTPQPNPLAGLGILNLLGFGEMLNGVNDEMGGLGAVLAVRDKVIEKKFEERDNQREHDRLVGENAILKQKIEEFEKEIKSLNGELDEAEDKIDDLEDELSEYTKLNPKRDVVSGLGGLAVEKGINLFLQKMPAIQGILNGLGIAEEIPATQPTNVPAVAIEEVDESPRGQAKQQITTWIDTLNEIQFAEFYELLTAFAKGEKTIASCLGTPAPIMFPEDDTND